MKCNNCCREHDDLPDVCLPAAMLGVSVFSREELTPDEADTLLENLNVDQLWDDIGPIIDRIQEGYYNINDDDGCPLNDPDCVGRNEDSHIACEENFDA